MFHLHGIVDEKGEGLDVMWCQYWVMETLARQYLMNKLNHSNIENNSHVRKEDFTSSSDPYNCDEI